MSIIVGALGMLQNGASVLSMGLLRAAVVFYKSNRKPSPAGPTTNPLTITVTNPEYLLHDCLALLGIFLLVCGILTLLNRRQARRLHLIYAATNVPLAILGSAVYTWGMMSSFGATPQASVYFAICVGRALITLAYPVAVLIVMWSPRVKAYYESMARQIRG